MLFVVDAIEVLGVHAVSRVLKRTDRFVSDRQGKNTNSFLEKAFFLILSENRQISDMVKSVTSMLNAPVTQ